MMKTLLEALRRAWSKACPVCERDLRAEGIKPVGKLGACSEEHAHELDVATAW